MLFDNGCTTIFIYVFLQIAVTYLLIHSVKSILVIFILLSLFYFGIINKMLKGKDSILVFSRKKIRYWFSCASVVLLCVGYARPYVSLDVSLTPDWQVSTKSTQKSEIRVLGSELCERAGNVAQEVKDKKALSSKQLEQILKKVVHLLRMEYICPAVILRSWECKLS